MSELPVTLVEYGDYQCPDCGRLFVELEKLQSELNIAFRLAFRHYPLSGIHPQAQIAAEAAEAASAQDRFWEMHDLLFRNQSALRKKDLARYGEQLGLDMNRFNDEMKHHVHAERVRKQFKLGVQNGVYTTPGLFVNGVRFSKPVDGITPHVKALISNLADEPRPESLATAQ
ncbi:MAG: thioredoxin domain-containing protein [Acidobacteriaceae bacterium]|nr:thioredoxin domain-containing protein [Acidobacteriaceae bacterium]